MEVFEEWHIFNDERERDLLALGWKKISDCTEIRGRYTNTPIYQKGGKIMFFECCFGKLDQFTIGSNHYIYPFGSRQDLINFEDINIDL